MFSHLNIDKTHSLLKAKKPRLRAQPTYSGVGRTSQWKKKKQLQEAAKGCRSITTFFNPGQNTVSPNVNELTQNDAILSA
jgi:hypothetical protein